MSKLFYTSSFIDNQKFTDIEDVFKYIEPSELILIFDTNVVIDYRQYFFNPTQFTHPERREFLKSLRNLVKKIEFFNLEVNASFGVEESCREPFDFSINKEKFEQTHATIMQMLHSGIKAFDNHLTTREYFGEEIKLMTEFPTTKLNCLKQESTHQHLLIVSYITMLRTIELFYQIQEGKTDRLDAFKILVEFMRSELDVYSGMHAHYAVHLFGGASGFKELWSKKSAKSSEKKLHNIFNASIDLICPVIAGKTQQLFDKPGNKKLIPVFVSGDKILSDLHSHRNIKVIFEENPSIVQSTFTPEAVLYDFHIDKLNWTKEDYISILDISAKANNLTMKAFSNSSNTALHYLYLVNPLENKVISLIRKN